MLVYKSNVDVMCAEYVSYPQCGLKNGIKFTSGKSLFHTWGIILYDLHFLSLSKNEGIIHNETNTKHEKNIINTVYMKVVVRE